jgi:hypothetical protein
MFGDCCRALHLRARFVASVSSVQSPPVLEGPFNHAWLMFFNELELSRPIAHAPIPARGANWLR